MFSLEELSTIVSCCYVLVLASVAFSTYIFIRLDRHFAKHEKDKEVKEIIDKTRYVLHDDFSEFFEHVLRSYPNESKNEKRE